VTQPPLPSFDHIFIVIMENHGYDEIIGSAEAPYINQLAARYGLATNYVSVAHPSLPNYLALTGGDTFGVTTDCTDCFRSAVAYNHYSLLRTIELAWGLAPPTANDAGATVMSDFFPGVPAVAVA
jgi:hypothetical protein